VIEAVETSVKPCLREQRVPQAALAPTQVHPKADSPARAAGVTLDDFWLSYASFVRRLNVARLIVLVSKRLQIRSTLGRQLPIFAGKKLNEVAEVRHLQRITKPLHYHCANPANTGDPGGLA
jgi:hypothetical protein